MCKIHKSSPDLKMKKREKKQKIIEELKNLFSQYENIFFISLKNLKVNHLNKLKKELSLLNSKLKVAKKTLIEIANQNIAEILKNPIFKIPTGIIFSNRNIDLEIINLLDKYKNELKLEIIGGYLNNSFYSSEQVLPLAKFKNKDLIYYNLVSNLKNNLIKLVFTLKHPLIKFNSVVNNIKHKNAR